MKHVISILVENEFGVLARISGLFSARGYNIDTLTVSPTDDESMSRLTLVTSGTDKIVEQISKQLNKLVDVIKIQNLCDDKFIQRQTLLIKFRANNPDDREEIKRLADIFSGHIIDVSSEIYTVELSADPSKVNEFISAAKKLEKIEVIRSGITGIACGERSLSL